VSDVVSAADLDSWVAGLDELFARVACRFGRVEPRRQARAYLTGLLAPVERKNGWQLAEAAGDATPDKMQRLLNVARWDPDAVRDDLRAYVAERLGDKLVGCLMLTAALGLAALPRRQPADQTLAHG
jgi:SRSO17 transposase